MESTGKIIIKKLKDAGIIWFGASNQWVYLEEPALYVFRQLRKNISPENISRQCSNRYKLSEEESIRFVNELVNSFTQFENPLNISNQNKLPEIKKELRQKTLFAKHSYRINKKNITISYDSLLAEYYIHPPLAHLAITDPSDSDADFEIFIYDEHPVLLMKNNREFPIIFESFNRLKRKLFIEISNIIYNKTTDKWMTFLHAAGISMGREAVLLSSASGSGKSTMAALLHASGLNLISDDFIPINAGNKLVYPFPAAISIKKDAFSLLSPYYGDLNNKNYNIYPYTHSSVRYLRPLASVNLSYKPVAVKAIVFINYNPEIRFEFAELSIPAGLRLFHEQAWVSDNPEHARSFINWFVKLKCFKMQYSDKNQGMDAIISLFDQNL